MSRQHGHQWLSPTSVACHSQSCISAISDSQAGVGPSKRPCPKDAEERGGVQHPLWQVPTNVHRQTGRTLDHRLAEQQQALKNGDMSASAIAEHVFVPGHQVDLSKAMVIDTHPHAQTHCLPESWHIQHEQTASIEERELYQDSMPPCWTDSVLDSPVYYIYLS